MSQTISQATIDKFKQDLANKPSAGALQRAVMNNGINATSESTAAKAKMAQIFSIDLHAEKVSNQKQSGRCWMFAALNTMRRSLADQFNLKDFELSQNYTFFWDKFEKSNYFYENILATADEPTSSRKVAFLLTTPQQDGGQWDMLTALIDKYGIVPQYAMPETYNSNKSNELNGLLNLKLRKDAVTLRQMVQAKASDAEIAAAREKMLGEVYRILVYTLGEPPVKFDFEYRDDNKKYHIDQNLTPQAFFDKYVGWNLDDYQSLINAPTDDKPYNQLYTVEMLGNVVGGRQVRHLNLNIADFKQLAIKQLENGEAVWFGSDVGQFSDRQIGIMDPAIYAKDDLFDVDFSLTKAQRLDYAESLMTHAMVITGVDLVAGKPTKWKVENSWGDKVGEKGYFVMSDAWFDEFVYQIVINKKYLSDAQKAITKKDPKVLAPWDPMGALASH